MNKPRCDECKWWEEVETGRIHTQVGICRRMPPSARPANDDLSDRRGYALWPTLREHDWCGAHEHK